MKHGFYYGPPHFGDLYDIVLVGFFIVTPRAEGTKY